jgi:ketosteroid isomerase-like protein
MMEVSLDTVPGALGTAFAAGDAATAAKVEEQANIDRLQRMFGVIAAGRFEELPAFLAPDVRLEIVVPHGIPWVCSTAGAEEVAAAVAANFRAVCEQRPEPLALVAQGDTVMVMGRESGRLTDSGEPYRMLLAQQYTFRDGRLAEFRSVAGYLDDPPATSV